MYGKQRDVACILVFLAHTLRTAAWRVGQVFPNVRNYSHAPTAGTIQDNDKGPLLDSVTVQIHKPPVPPDSKHWEAAAKGRLVQDDDEVPDAGFTQGFIDAQHHHLGQIAATAISGNDITSSCLYVAGLAAVGAGKFAPISLLLVVVILYLFKGTLQLMYLFFCTRPVRNLRTEKLLGVYSEVGSALPLNGGAYNVLLNTTTKLLAALAACLTLLSYVATAVVSGSEGTIVFFQNCSTLFLFPRTTRSSHRFF